MSRTVQVPVPALKKTISVQTGLFINNEFVASVDSQELIQFVNIFFLLLAMVIRSYHSAINPATEEVICSVVAGILLIPAYNTTLI